MNIFDVEYIAHHIRAHDAIEVNGVRWDDNPINLARETVDILMNLGRGYVVKHRGVPAAVIGVCEVHPGVWQGMAYGTDDFRAVMTRLTRIARDDLAPFIREHGGHRLEVLSRADHVESHKWLVYLGAMREGVMRQFGKDGADFIRFAWTRDS